MSMSTSLATDISPPPPETLLDSVPEHFQYSSREAPSPVHLPQHNRHLQDLNALPSFERPDELRRRLQWVQEQTAQLLLWITSVELVSVLYASFGPHAAYNWLDPLELQPVQQPIDPPTLDDFIFGPNAAAAQHGPGDHPADPIVIADDSDEDAEDMGGLEGWGIFE